MELHQCPCCDYFTPEERAGWDICPVCYWEDNGTDLDGLDRRSGCSHGLTLRQGRDNFERLGACEPGMLEHVCSAAERGQFHRERRVVA